MKKFHHNKGKCIEYKIHREKKENDNKRVTIGFKIRLKANVNLTIENYIYKNPYISLFYVLCKRDSIVLINSIVTSQKIQSPFPYDSVIKSHMFSE